ncbi:MAG: RNA-binding domain-containing protein [Candidatus Thorarchaeota archaeon]|jgi:RNA binding exosome subunit
MPFVSRIETRAYSRSTEVVERVAEAILNLYPEDLRESVKITSESAESHKNTEIVVISAYIESRRLCELTFTQIVESLSERDRKFLRRTLSRRLDDQCVLFLRIDKQASYLGETRLASDSDVIRVRVHLREYPRCARSDAEEFLIDRLQ